MVRFKVKDQEFSIPETWEEITISDFVRFTETADKEESKLKEILEVDSLEKVSDVEIFSVYPEYFINLLASLGGVSEELLKKCNGGDVFAVYSVLSETLANLPSDEKKDHFIHAGQKYYFPKPETDIDGTEALAGKETYGAMIYAFQQEANLRSIKNGRYQALPRQMAILCRKEGEEFSTDLARERTKIFQKLPMSICWQFVFFSIGQSSSFSKRILSYSQEAEEN